MCINMCKYFYFSEAFPSILPVQIKYESEHKGNVTVYRMKDLFFSVLLIHYIIQLLLTREKGTLTKLFLGIRTTKPFVNL